MVRTKITPHRVSRDHSTPREIVHVPISIGPEIELEEESRQPKSRPPYRDVRKFWNDGSEDGRIPEML